MNKQSRFVITAICTALLVLVVGAFASPPDVYSMLPYQASALLLPLPVAYLFTYGLPLSQRGIKG